MVTHPASNGRMLGGHKPAQLEPRLPEVALRAFEHRVKASMSSLVQVSQPLFAKEPIHDLGASANGGVKVG